MTSKIVVNNIEADSGINTITFINEVTAPTFNGNIVGTAATFSGNVDIAGALTYEDVTNVDSVGIVTARSGIHVTGGNVAIGLNNPSAPLHLSGPAEIRLNNATDAGNFARIRCFEESGDNGAHLVFNTGAGEVVRFRNDGNVGIGTDNPGQKLTVRGTTSLMATNSTNVWMAYTHTDNTFRLNYNGAGADEITVLSSGEVGVGAFTPGAGDGILQIAGGLRIAGSASASDTTSPYIYRTSGADNLNFATNGSERLRINANGLVGVNCTPLSQFQVKTSTNANIALSADGSEASIEAYNDAGSANVPLRIRGSEIKFKIDGTQRARLYYSSNSAVLALGDESNSAGHLRFEAKASENQIHGRSNHPISFLINTGEKLKLHTSGLLEGKGAQFTANVTPSSGRGVEIFEAGTGVGQISSYNRDGNGWDELRIKGSEVKLYAGTTNALTLNLQRSQSTLYGTSDGILNLDTTDGRGSFIRFKENGNTKAWVGCAEGMGGGTSSPDQDDLGLRAVGNILFSSNGSERLRINENGEIEVDGNSFISINEPNATGNFYQEITYEPNNKGCMYLANFAYYSNQPALVINDKDTNNARVMEDVQFQRNGSMVGYIRINPSSVTYSQSGSDIRLKKNFEDWTEDNLSKFRTLSPKLFNWIDDEDGTEKTKGFIAQDNLDKFPEAYDLTASTDRYYFNPSGMVHYMMKALQEAATKIETMEARIAALEGS